MSTTTGTAPTSLSDTLRQAKALIADPKHWIKGSEAQVNKRDADSWVMPRDPTAGAWCAIGAIKKVDGPYEADALATLTHTISGYDSDWSDIGYYNDAPHRRHKHVMAKFDKAIAAAEKAEAAS